MRKAIVIFCSILFLLSVYWVKCQLGINLLSDFAWEKHFTFLKVLQRNEFLASPPPGVLLASSFDGWWPSAAWHGIWMRDKGMAQTSVIADAGRGSRCLSIRSRSPHDWGMQHGAAFAVSAGDVFAFEGYARTDSAAVAQLSVVTYDEQRTPLNWFFAVENVRSASWVKVSRSFTVPAGVKYVRFRLTGYGIGDAYFDDIKFVKEK